MQIIVSGGAVVELENTQRQASGHAPVDAQIARIAAWAVVGLVLFQSVAVLASVTSVTVERAEAIAGIVASLVSAVLFVWIHYRLNQNRHVPLWSKAVIVGTTVVAYMAGAWMNPSLALAVLLLSFTGVVSLILSGIILIFMALIMLFDGADLLVVSWYLMFNLVLCAVLYVVTRLAQAIRDLRHTREMLARMRIDQERQRISRDLHDILGRSLVAVSLRLQTALLLLKSGSTDGHEHVEEAGRLVLEGQTALRRVVNGETFVDLEHEIDNAATLLRRIGVDVDLQVPEVVPEDTESVGARLIREAVTNALKHARPRRVSIKVVPEDTEVVVEVTNDGLITKAHPTQSSGTGLNDLNDRVCNAGGKLHCGLDEHGTYTVRALLPLKTPNHVEHWTEPA